MHAGVADVPDGYAGIGIALLYLEKAFRSAQVGRGTHAHILNAELLEEKKIVIGRLGHAMRT